MTRLLWFGAGAAAAVYTTGRLRRVRQHLTASGLAAQLSAIGAGLRVFATDVQEGMAEREAQLRESMGRTDPSGHRPALAEVPSPRPDREIA